MCPNTKNSPGVNWVEKGDEPTDAVACVCIADSWPRNPRKRPRRAKTQQCPSKVKERNGRNGGPMKTAPLRAEKSRLAAKGRRDNELQELENLSELLPFKKETLSKLDKATIVRLSICFLQTKEFIADALNEVTQKGKDSSLSQYSAEAAVTEAMKAEEGRLMMEALDGFLVFVGKNGRILFVSEQVEKHLGSSPVEMMGLSALEFIHNEDHKEFVRQFLEGRLNKTEIQKNSHSPMDFTDSEETTQTLLRDRQFYVRMKCQLVKPGTKTRHFGHLLTQWSGRLQCRGPPNGGGTNNIVGLVAIVRPVDTEPIVDIRLDGNVFMSRHDLSMRFTFCDPRILKLVGYYPDELMGKTAYQFHNPVDAMKIHNCHTNLIAKGTSVSKYYRFLGKTGEWVWMKTRATIIYNSDKKAQYVVCLNYVYSDEEGQRCLLLEEDSQGSKDANVQGYIDILALEGSASRPDQVSVAELNNKNNNEVLEPSIHVPDQHQLSLLSHDQPSTSTGSCFPLPVTSEATLDHTYPVAAGAIQSSGELPAGFAATGFPQFLQHNFTDNTALQLQDTSSALWLDGLDATLNKTDLTFITSNPLAIPKAVPNKMATTTTVVNRDYRLAVSDHDYSAKPDSLRELTNGTNYNSNLFSNDSGLDDVEMMDTDILDTLGTVSFGRTSYDDNPPSQNGGSLSGENLLGALSALSKAGLNIADDLDENDSLFEALGECHNGYGKSLLQSTGLSLTEFPSAMLSSSSSLDMYGSNSNNESLATQFAESVINDQVKGLSYSFGRTDPCMGVTSLEHLATTTTKSIGKKPGGLNQNLNSHTLGLVDTPPPSPKLIRSGVKLQKPQHNHSRHHSSPTVTYSPPSCSPPRSGASSSNSSTSRSPTSPPANLSLNKSWPNTSKSTRGRNGSSSSSAAGGRLRNGGGGHSSRGSHSRHADHKHKASTGSSLLEQFLTTKQRINPNRGSDNVFKESRVTERISKLQIGKDKTQQDDNNLLQQLLTGAIDGKHVHRYEQNVIKTRRQDSENNTPLTSPLTSPLMSDIDLDSESLTPDTPVLNLFDTDPEAEMNSLLGTLSPEVDILMHSDLDDILREQSRQEELWHREYVS